MGLPGQQKREMEKLMKSFVATQYKSSDQNQTKYPKFYEKLSKVAVDIEKKVNLKEETDIL